VSIAFEIVMWAPLANPMRKMMNPKNVTVLFCLV
jgi:hypothetical protein